MSFKVLAIGDVFGRPGRKVLSEELPKIIEDHNIEFVIVNGENAAGGKGITPDICRQFYTYGVDVITTGNHARDKKEIDSLLANSDRVLRPENYGNTIPGTGFCIRESKSGYKIAVANIMGNVHMGKLPCPFHTADTLYERVRAVTPYFFIDFHAEATSEKRAMGWYMDGRASAVFGTHTHVQTADEEILPQGTGYITDLGMTGPYHSVIGLKIDVALGRFLKKERKKFDVGKGNEQLCGSIFEVNKDTGHTLAVSRLCVRGSE